MITKQLTATDYATLAYQIASQYVTDPALLRVSAEARPEKIIVRFPGTHRKKDHGKLIGNSGKHFQALQRILKETAIRNRQKVFLEVIEPVGAPEREEDGVKHWIDESWNTEDDEALRVELESIVEKVLGWSAPVRVFSSRNRTHLILETESIEPELLAAFKVLWLAIGRQHGRDIVLNAQAAEQKAV